MASNSSEEPLQRQCQIIEQGLWPILQPPIRRQSGCFGFTFGELTWCLFLWTVCSNNSECVVSVVWSEIHRHWFTFCLIVKGENTGFKPTKAAVWLLQVLKCSRPTFDSLNIAQRERNKSPSSCRHTFGAFKDGIRLDDLTFWEETAWTIQTDL